MTATDDYAALPARGQQLIDDAYRYGMLTADAVRRLRWPDLAPDAARKTLARAAEEGWLSRYTLAGQEPYFVLGLAVAAVLVLVAALLAVALARWLALDDLLQRLPLLFVLGLVGVGLVFLTSLPLKGPGAGGFELFGGLFILIAVVSVLGSLYRPLAASYQTVTLKIPVRDLCATAAAMLVSLTLAVAGQSLPRPVLPLLVCVLSGAFAGLVVVEYAAWARANPGRSLDQVRAFCEPPAAAGAARKPARAFDSRSALRGVALFGLCHGLWSTILLHGVGPSSELHRLLPPPSPEGTVSNSEFLATLALFSFLGMPCAWLWANSSLNALRVPNAFLAFRVARDALVVFLTYPETTYPLAHRIHTPWLRPQSARLAATCLLLLAAATSLLTPPKESPKTEAEKKAATSPASQPQPPRSVPPGDLELARIERGTRDDFAEAITGSSPVPFGPAPGMSDTPPPPATEPPASDSRPIGTRVAEFAITAVAIAVVPPFIAFFIVWLVGMAVLPTYFNYFEKPETTASPG